MRLQTLIGNPTYRQASAIQTSRELLAFLPLHHPKHIVRLLARQKIISGITLKLARRFLASKENLQPGRGIIAPNGAYHSKLSANGYYEAKLGRLIVHGRIDYVDVFGTGHWTKFCYCWIPGTKASKGGFAPCDTGNSIDDYHPPNLIK